MSHHSEARPPAAFRAIIRLASWLVPPEDRADWYMGRHAALCGLWILIQRGEVAFDSRSQLAHFSMNTLARAVHMRFNVEGWRRWSRGPVFVVAAAAAVLLLVVAATHGLPVTHRVIDAARSLGQKPPHGGYDPRGDMVVGYTFPVAAAVAVGAVLIAIGRRALNRGGWRYWLFLASKIVLAAAIATVLWIEGGAWLRAHMSNETLRGLAGCLGFALAFIGAFGWSVVWSLSDQRRRCPVCLRRLALPVSLGSWASVFDPPSTEMVCSQGHGTLCVAEAEISHSDRWVVLDASWRGMFTPDSHDQTAVR